MIIDEITGKTYEAERCCICGSEEIYVLHTTNPRFPDDIE